MSFTSTAFGVIYPELDVERNALVCLGVPEDLQSSPLSRPRLDEVSFCDWATGAERDEGHSLFSKSAEHERILLCQFVFIYYLTGNDNLCWDVTYDYVVVELAVVLQHSDYGTEDRVFLR